MTTDLHHLAAAYAVDALDDDERAAFEAHYRTCEACRTEVRRFHEAAGLLAGGSASTPPAGLERSVMDAIARTPQESPIATDVSDLDDRRRRRSRSTFLAAAAAVVILVVGAVAIIGQRGGGSDVDEVVAAPDAVITTLALTPDGAAGSFQVVWSQEQGRIAVIADDLPDPGTDRAYELWAIEGDTPVSAGVFVPDDGSVREAVDLDDLDLEDADAAAWGVTVEPASGSAAPTTPILFFATT